MDSDSVMIGPASPPSDPAHEGRVLEAACHSRVPWREWLGQTCHGAIRQEARIRASSRAKLMICVWLAALVK